MAAETGDLSVSVEKRVNQQDCCNIFVRTKVGNKQNHFPHMTKWTLQRHLKDNN